MFSEITTTFLIIFRTISYVSAGVLNALLVMHLDNIKCRPIRIRDGEDLTWTWIASIIAWPIYLLTIGIRILAYKP